MFDYLVGNGGGLSFDQYLRQPFCTAKTKVQVLEIQEKIESLCFSGPDPLGPAAPDDMEIGIQLDV